MAPAESSEEELNARIERGEADDEPLETTLRTDQRVLARVTDGIYRQPASALRELISNAYDADATRVTIRTERPEFRRMSIDDNGIGMSSRTLLRMLHHIGGSTKRTSIGSDYNVTSESDPNRSPGGRRLIGKIGIGLFSVAQLTQAFDIVTKVRGQSYQTIASVLLRQYSEDALTSDRETYDAGLVQIRREPVSDLARQGTSVILTAIRPQTREALRSLQRWQSVFAQEDEITKKSSPPAYHVGVVDDLRPQYLRLIGDRVISLPWRSGVEGRMAMREMVDAVQDSVGQGIANPSTAKLFDNYLDMAWGLSLAPPLPYIDGHPFDLREGSGLQFYSIPRTDAPAVRLELAGRSVREAADLGQDVRSPTDFQVDLDDLTLLRPLSFTTDIRTSAALTASLLFVASHREDFAGVDREMSGGPLEFQAYFFVAPKIIPIEHRGVKIRIGDASGLAYDDGFLNFPVAELQRLSQITCEIYVIEGLDGALNIDRESFNYSHAHVRALTRWLHAALRRVLAEQKRLGTQAMRARRESRASAARSTAEAIVDRVWSDRAEVGQLEPPDIRIGPDSQGPRSGGYVLSEEVVGQFSGPNSSQRSKAARELVSSIAKVLVAYDLLEDLTDEERNSLLGAIRELVQAIKL